MSIPISTYVDIAITRTSTGISKQSFETPLILAPVSIFYDRTKEYNSLPEVAVDFPSGDVYDKAAAIFGQNPRPRILKVGRKYENVNAVQRIKLDVAGTGGTFKLKWGSEETAAIAYDANVAAIKAAIEALSFTTVTVAEIVAKKEWTITFSGVDGNKHQVTPTVSALPTSATLGTVTIDAYGSAVETYSVALDNICIEDDEFYGICATTVLDADVTLIAANVQARRKIYVAMTNDTTIVSAGSSDIASVLKTAGYTRTHLCYSSNATQDHDAATLGRMLPYDAGSATWAYKNLEGQTVDTYTSGQRTFALNKNANIFHEVASARITEQGRTVGGEFTDVMIGVDYIQARMEENMWQALKDADKIPYTDAGVGIIAGIVRATLKDAVNKGIITDTYTVFAPLVADQSTTDRANRLFPDISFAATLQGAIHYIGINGTVSV